MTRLVYRGALPGPRLHLAEPPRLTLAESGPTPEDVRLSFRARWALVTLQQGLSLRLWARSLWRDLIFLVRG